MGGDEFVVLLTEIDEETARVAMLRLYKSLFRAMERKEWEITFSIGVITFLKPPTDADELVRQVDKLMYAVKTDGKNNIRFAIAGA
jgi:diguanylate cyclase (GGDEF)-like protein